jgi:hypothetical protein
MNLPRVKFESGRHKVREEDRERGQREVNFEGYK